MPNRFVNLQAAFLLAIGFLQMTGNSLHLSWLGQAGFATAASPAPLVFCRQDNIESFACHYSLEWKDKKDRAHVLPLGPGSQGLIPGPQARRSMYLQTLTDGASQEKSMVWSVKHYVTAGPLLLELGIHREDIQWPVTIRIVTPGDSLMPVAVFSFGEGFQEVKK